MKELIKRLVEAYGPAGSEENVRELIAAEVKPYVDEVKTDALGNLIAIKRGGGSQKLMLSSHMDEIGVMVTHIDDDGFLRFYGVGGISPFNLLGNRCYFANGTVGVFGAERLDAMKDLSINKMYIDIGVSSKEEAQKKVRIGDTAAIKREFTDLGDRLVSKAMDNRISCAVLIKALQQVEKPVYDIYAVFSAQEEVGLRGARTAAYGITPDLGIAIDVTGTGDTPKSATMDVALGQGPTVKVRDSSLICTPAVRRFMEEVAQKHDIPYQLEVLERGGTDGGAIQMTKSGIPAGVMSIPCRYIHSPSEMVDYGDVQKGVQFIVKIMETSYSG